MTRIVRMTYRYKRPPRKRKPNPAALAMPAIVTAKTPKPGRLPPRVAKAAADQRQKPQVIEAAQVSADRPKITQAIDVPTNADRKSAIVTIRRRKHATLSHLLDDMTPEEHRQRGDAADELFREMKRRIAEKLR